MNSITELKTKKEKLEQQLKLVQEEIKEHYAPFYEDKHKAFQDDASSLLLTIEGDYGSWSQTKKKYKNDNSLPIAYIKIDKSASSGNKYDYESVTLNIQTLKQLNSHIGEIIDFLELEDFEEEG